MAERQRQLYLDVLRIVSIAAVVVIHTAAEYWTALDVTSYEWKVETVYDGLVRWAVPVFVMISGALFLDPSRDQPIKKLYGKNILRIVTIILFWGTIYALLAGLPSDASAPSLYAFFKAAIFGHYHMWFLYMIIGLYAMTPLLRLITKDQAATRYFLAAAFLLNTAIPFICSFGKLYSLAALVDTLQIQLPLGYSFYFMLGYYLKTVNMPRTGYVIAGVLGAIGLAFTVLLTLWASARAGAPVSTYFDNFSLPVCLTSTSIFLMARYRGEKSDNSRKGGGRIITALSSCTLGVYMIHAMLLEKLHAAGITTLSFDPALAIPLIAGGVITVSFALSFILKQIPVVKTYFV